MLDLGPQLFRHRFERRKIVVALEDQIVELADRRQRPPPPRLDLELPDEASRHIAEPARLARDRRHEPVALALAEVGDILENLGARANRRDPREHPVQELPEQRIGAQPVGIVVGPRLCPLIRPMQPRDHQRRRRLERDKIAGRDHPGLGQPQHRVRERRLDLGDQPVLGLARKRTDLDLELAREPQQQRAADASLVAFDEVEIARGNPRLPRQRGLRNPQRPPPRADAQTDRRPHRCPPSVNLLTVFPHGKNND